MLPEFLLQSPGWFVLVYTGLSALKMEQSLAPLNNALMLEPGVGLHSGWCCCSACPRAGHVGTARPQPWPLDRLFVVTQFWS